MSSKPSPRERARQIIADYQTGKGAFAGISPSKATDIIKTTPQDAKPNPTAAARREAMIQRQADPTDAMSNIVNPHQWEITEQRRKQNG